MSEAKQQEETAELPERPVQGVVMPRLTSAQRRVMPMMSRKWTAHQQHGCAVYINGKRVCNIDTMTVLERLGLVERDTRWTWRATTAGIEWKA
jgi:hypothetical protein